MILLTVSWIYTHSTDSNPGAQRDGYESRKSIRIRVKTRSQQVDPEHPALYLSTATGLGVLAVCSVVGMAYEVVELRVTGKSADWLFVILLIAATAFLIAAMHAVSQFLLTASPQSFEYINTRSSDRLGTHYLDVLKLQVYKAKNMTAAGLVYALCVSTAPLLLNVWPHIKSLRVLLCVFLFSVNFMTGVAVYGVIALALCLWRIWPSIPIDLWGRENPGTYLVFSLSRRVAIMGGFYSSVCISSTLFSKLYFGGYLIAYSVFAAVINLVSMATPGFLSAVRASGMRRRVLYDVNARVEKEFKEIMTSCQSETGVVNLGELENLLTLRKKVRDLRSLRLSARMTGVGLSIVLIAWLPPILQVALQHLWK